MREKWSLFWSSFPTLRRIFLVCFIMGSLALFYLSLVGFCLSLRNQYFGNTFENYYLLLSVSPYLCFLYIFGVVVICVLVRSRNLSYLYFKVSVRVCPGVLAKFRPFDVLAKLLDKAMEHFVIEGLVEREIWSMRHTNFLLYVFSFWLQVRDNLLTWRWFLNLFNPISGLNFFWSLCELYFTPSS